MFPRWSHCQDCGTKVVETSWSMLKQIETYEYSWIHTKHRKNMKNPLTSLNHEITSTAPANAVSTCLGLVRPPDWRRLVWICWSSIPIKDAWNPKRLKRLKVQNMVSQKKSPSSQPYLVNPSDPYHRIIMIIGPMVQWSRGVQRWGTESATWLASSITAFRPQPQRPVSQILWVFSLVKSWWQESLEQAKFTCVGSSIFLALFAMSRSVFLYIWFSFIWVSLNWEEHALLDFIGGLGREWILKNPMITSSFGLSTARASQLPCQFCASTDARIWHYL